MREEQMKAFLDTDESLTAEIDALIEKRGRLRWHMRSAMMDQAATFYENEDWTVEIKGRIAWNEEALHPLKEFYTADEIEQLMNKPKPRLWNKRVLKKEARKGGEIGKIIMAAQEEGALEIYIKAKDKK